jgi:hypothetical protein
MADHGKSVVHVWHDPSGQIVAVGRAAEAIRRVVVPLAQDEVQVVEQEVDDGLIQDLHRTHRVEPGSQSLVLVERPRGF